MGKPKNPRDPGRGQARSHGPSRRARSSRGQGRPDRPPQQRRSALRIRPIEDGAFAIVHPPCVEERRDDYEEGLLIWKSGEPEDARDVFRFALEGCGDNLYIHAALGRLALEADRDALLARGHFGYAVELVRAALGPNFRGRLPREAAENQPLYDALDGLIASLTALGRHQEADELRGLADRWSGVEPPTA